MTLPTYNKNNRRRERVQLPKGAYVVRILSVKVVKTKAGNDQLVIAFDINEGEYKDHYKAMYDRNTNEDKKWPNDGVFRLTVPYPGCPDYIVLDWDSFFADLEDSNNGFVFSGDEKALKGKIIGAKMRIEDSEWKGTIYSNVRMKWSCTADAVRQGKPGKMPRDKRIQKDESGETASATNYAGFQTVDNNEELPFD